MTKYRLTNSKTGAVGYTYKDRARAERELEHAVPREDWTIVEVGK